MIITIITVIVISNSKSVCNITKPTGLDEWNEWAGRSIEWDERTCEEQLNVKAFPWTLTTNILHPLQST